MNAVRLINCFEVPDGGDDAFLAGFRQVNAYMASKPGYLNHRLHRSVSPDARFRYVNYVEWQSVEHLAAARDEQYQELARAVMAAGATSTHALYEIVHEGSAPAGNGSLDREDAWIDQA